MSLILDALRKSEAERRRGDAPDLFAPMPTAGSSTRSRPALVPALTITSLLALTAAAWWWTHRAPHAVETAPRAAMAPIAARPVAAPPPAPLPRMTAKPAVPSAAAAADRQAPPAAPAPATRSESLPPPARMATVARAPAAAPRSEDRGAPVASDAGLARLGELDAARRATLPPLKLSMHVWDENPDHRFAIIDGQRVIEGSVLGDTLVHEIRRDGVVLTIDGRDYLLPR